VIERPPTLDEPQCSEHINRLPHRAASGTCPLA